MRRDVNTAALEHEMTLPALDQPVSAHFAQLLAHRRALKIQVVCERLTVEGNFKFPLMLPQRFRCIIGVGSQKTKPVSEREIFPQSERMSDTSSKQETAWFQASA